MGTRLRAMDGSTEAHRKTEIIPCPTSGPEEPNSQPPVPTPSWNLQRRGGDLAIPSLPGNPRQNSEWRLPHSPTSVNTPQVQRGLLSSYSGLSVRRARPQQRGSTQWPSPTLPDLPPTPLPALKIDHPGSCPPTAGTCTAPHTSIHDSFSWLSRGPPRSN